MKAISCILWTSIWVLALISISGLAGIDGWLTAAISIVTLVGVVGSLAIALRDDDAAPVADKPVEQADAEVVPSISVHVQSARLALPAPADRELARFR